MYLAQQPGMAHHQLQQFDVPYSQAPDEVHYSTAALFQDRPAENTPPYASLRTRNPMPEVTEWSPQVGGQGAHMVVMLMSAYEMDPTWRFDMHFGDRTVPCTLTMTGTKGVYYESALSLDVPLAPESAWTAPKVALSLEGTDATGASMGVVHLGSFTYTGRSHGSAQSSPQLSRKRRRSLDTDECPLPAKRIAQQQLRAASESAYEQQPFGYLTESPSLLALDGDYGAVASPRPGHRQNSSNATSAPLHRPTPSTPSWTPTPATTQSPQLAAPQSRKPMGLSPIMVNPKLCRTTTLQQSPSPAATPLGTPAPVSSFNPYAIPFNKAVLKIVGDLDEMTKDWSEAENDANRRLVHFWRTQSGSTINASFKPVAPDERQPSYICISCIWWEAKKDHFVTSVDTIYLLENLVGGRFTVEEKNRIRRNLEGFRPLTVSKGKPDSEDFFKLIMGFPNPKPRNIEKDVKVFPWKILAHALKKIMGKYSASYSSMAGTLPQSAAGSFHELPPSLLAPLSPHSSSDGVLTTGYDHAQLAALGTPGAAALSYAPPPTATMAPVSGPGGYLYGYHPAPTMPMSAPAQPPHPHHHQHSASISSHGSVSMAPQQHYRPASVSWDYPNGGAGYMASPVSAVSTSTPLVDPSAHPGHPGGYFHLHASSGT